MYNSALDDRDRVELNRLPEPEPRQADDTALTYGFRVLGFVIKSGITATVSTDDLQLADHASILATAPHDVSIELLRAVTLAKHLIASTLAIRARLDSAAISVPIVVSDVPKPNVGPMARMPEPVAPRRPPSMSVDIAF